MVTSSLVKKLSILAAGTAIATFGVATAGNAATIIDQNQPNSPFTGAYFSQTELAQSFQQSANNIAGASIFLDRFSQGTGHIAISLWDGLPSAGGNFLAGGAVTDQVSGTWADVFWNPVAVTPNTNLFLVFQSSNPDMGITGDYNPYLLGQLYADGSSFPSFDYTFRTFADDSFGNPTPTSVPEPASVLGLLAVGTLGATIKRKKKDEA